jgi:hypothetical protein
MTTHTCSVCGNNATLSGGKSINYSCNDYFTGEAQFPETTNFVEYFSCEFCGFFFSPDYDSWSSQDFSDRIYNEDYIKTDPPFLYARPSRNAQVISSVLLAVSEKSSADRKFDILDYGSGSGVFGRIMGEFGFDVANCDPHYGNGNPGDKKFDVITAFEVVEHVRHDEQHALFARLSGLIKSNGVVIFSTRVQKGYGTKNPIGWWYVAPRNGHISVHSEFSLETIAEQHGFSLHSFNEDVHMLYKNPSRMSARMAMQDIAGQMDVMAETFADLTAGVKMPMRN